MFQNIFVLVLLMAYVIALGCTGHKQYENAVTGYTYFE